MKTIIAGSRGFDDLFVMMMEMAKLDWRPTEVVSGTAPGADRTGECWANMFDIPLKRMPAQWDKFGRVAGKMRNVEMAEYAEALVAFWDGISPGTWHMIDTAKRLGLKVVIIPV
jgi:hypothetical protein